MFGVQWAYHFQGRRRAEKGVGMGTKEKPRGLMGVRFTLALWAAKLSVPVLKLTRHNGTNFPGELAMKICPAFLRYIDKPERILAVTGTNGKTTVTNLLCDALTAAGHRVLSNRAGSNMYPGVATALLMGTSLLNRCHSDVAVLEIDERSSRLIFPHLTPEVMVVTNLFRDSIMRNAHPQYIADFLTRYIPKETRLVLNADDLISSAVAPDNERVYFGIERMTTDITQCVNRLNDMQICPRCAGPLTYDYLRYHHIGRVRCRECGFESPAYDYAGADASLEAMAVAVRDRDGEGTYRLISDSVFDIYNLVAAVAMLREFGMTHEAIGRCLAETKVVGTRHTDEEVNGVHVINQMAKGLNALACSRVFDYIASRPGEKEILLLMNCLSDERHWSENVCWLYDADFEFLADPRIHVIATGPRGKDYLLRLKLAGVRDEQIDYARDEFEAAEKLYLRPGSSVYLLYGADDSLDLAFKVRRKVLALAKEAKR